MSGQKPREEQVESGEELGQSQIRKSNKLLPIRSKIRKSKIGGGMFVCQICEGEFKDKVQFAECDHNSMFCEGCLINYVTYKVKMFEEVTCPSEGCTKLINTKTTFFSHLPKDIQSKYVKVHQFYQISKDPSLKLCPKEKCDGVIKILPGQPAQCNKCQQKYCQKCVYRVHEGPCDRNQVQFLQNVLHYQHCTKCKLIVQKSQGCNHMTCRCGHQFCYLCSKDWHSNHKCNEIVPPPVVAGQVVAHPVVPVVAPVAEPYRQPFNYCKCILLVLVVIFLGPFWLIGFILLPFLILTLYILVIIGTTIICLFVGIFIFSVSRLCEIENKCYLALLIIFFPVLIIYGLARAFYQIWYDSIPYLGQFYFCEAYPNIANKFCCR